MGQGTSIGAGIVLIVEDEALLRFDMIAFFEDRGWRVYDAENAEQAVSLLDQHRDIRVVITDVLIPGGMDGVRLAHVVREKLPATHLFVVSGQAPVAAEALPPRATFLPKPFDLNRMLRQIEHRPGSV